MGGDPREQAAPRSHRLPGSARTTLAVPSGRSPSPKTEGRREGCAQGPTPWIKPATSASPLCSPGLCPRPGDTGTLVPPASHPLSPSLPPSSSSISGPETHRPSVSPDSAHSCLSEASGPSTPSLRPASLLLFSLIHADLPVSACPHLSSSYVCRCVSSASPDKGYLPGCLVC